MGGDPFEGGRAQYIVYKGIFMLIISKGSLRCPRMIQERVSFDCCNASLAAFFSARRRLKKADN